MDILTNRLKINFNIDAIKRDFVFIRLERQSKDKKDKWYGRKELDYLFGKDFNAVSVMFQYGNFAYAMFKKTVDVYELLCRIRENEEFQNNAVIEVTPMAILDTTQDCICEAWLAQILLNSLSASKSRFPQYPYCNLTGSLLFVQGFDRKNKDSLYVAKITITSNFLLKVDILRYRTKISILSELNKVKETGNQKRITELHNALNKRHYKFEPSTASLRIHLARDGEIDAKSIYIECGIKGKKASIKFLEFGSSDDFYKSRAGILHHVKINIEKHLSKYMKIDFSTRAYEVDDTHTINNILMDKPQNLYKFIIGKEIHIVDRVNNEESLNLITDLKQLLYEHYITNEDSITVGKKDKKDAFNFRIIHDKSYYIQHKLKDEHKLSDSTTQRQNITIESNQGISMAIVKTTMKELIIKRDIGNKILSLFNWSELKYQKVWTFGLGVYNKDYKEIDKFIFMNIQPNGSFDFSEINRSLLGGYQQYNTCIEEIEKAKKDENKTGFELEGLVVSEHGDINLLFRTNEITIPNLSEIATIIDEVETPLPEDKRTGNSLADLIEKFVMQSISKDSDKLTLLAGKLRKLGNEEINKNIFNKIINDTIAKNSTVTKKLRKYLLSEHNIRLIFSKNKDNREELFEASLDIKYFGETKTEAYYFVGEGDIKDYSFKDACHIRKIVAANGSKLIFKELLPTMDVDFVRTGQSTVIPFPFKYIREYLNFAPDK